MTVQKKFVVSAADAYLYDVSNGDLIAVAKTLLDTSIETSLSNQDVRGGRGNPLLYVFYHSAEMNVKLSDAQWNLALLAKNTGSTISTGADVFTEEVVTLGAAGAGTVVGTPIASVGTNLYGWVTKTDGTVEKVTFTGKNFTSTDAEGSKVTVRYYHTNSAAKQMIVRSDMIPSVVRLVLEAQLVSPDATTNKIGTLQVEIPRASLTGSFSIQMTADGVGSTPLNVRAFRQEETIDGAIVPVYAYIREILDSANWYDDCIALAVEGGDFSLAAAATKTLVIRGIHSDGSVSVVPNADLDFTSATGATATVGLHTGIVTAVAAGTSVLHATATSKTSLDCYATVTVPA